MEYITNFRQKLNRAIANSTSNNSPNKIVFIDVQGNSNQFFLVDLDSTAEIILLDSDRDGIEQITEILAQRSNVQSLNIYGALNGNEANLQLGLTQLNINTLEAYAKDLYQWKNALTANSEILIHGCLVENESVFQSFIQQIAELTRTDVGAFVTIPSYIASNKNLASNSLMVAWQV